MFNIFGTSTPAAPAQQPAAPAAQPQITGAETPTAAVNGVVPPTPITPAEPAPLDKLATMVQPSNTTPPPPQDDRIFGAINPAEFQQAAGKIDFTKAITPEIMAAAAAGGEEGVKAMMAAVNAASQQVYAHSAAATTALIEKAISTHTERLTERLPSALTQHAINDQIATSPILGHAASKPILDGLVSQLRAANPTAPADVIVAKANEYLSTYAQQFISSTTPAPAGQVDNMDWEKFFDLPPNM